MIPPGEFHSLIMVRAKLGELEALEAVDDTEQVRHVQPMIELETAKQVDRVVTVIRQLNRLGRHAMVDASDFTGEATSAGGPPAIFGELIDRLSDLFSQLDPIRFIPVVRSGASDQQLYRTGEICQELAIGGAIRIRQSAASRDDMERAIDKLRVDVLDLDVIFDLQYIRAITPQLTDTVLMTLDALSALGPFRSTTVLSGSVPSSLQQVTAWEEPRFEEQLWHAVTNDRAKYVRFGDYGVVHPLPSQGFRSKHVTLKYTCPARWFYLREPMTEQDDDSDDIAENVRAHTFRSVCKRLIATDSYAGPDFSWGDLQMATAARGQGTGLGSTSKPVAFATSHHLAYLAARAAA